jgi:zinc transport system substrate-binding protein
MCNKNFIEYGGIRNMKKLGLLALTGILVVSLLAGCQGKGSNADIAANTKELGNTATTQTDDSNDRKLSVYASFYPLYDFAKKVGGDKIEIVNLVPPGIEPHDWEPAASDMVSLETADVFIYNGADMEHWVDKVLASLKTEKLIVVEASQEIELLEGHHDDHDEEKEHEEEEQHDEEEDHEEGHDPHVWLNPLYAKKQMEMIKQAFIEADSTNEAYYESNYQKYAVEFDALDKAFKEELAILPNKDIIVAHQAFGYLCAAYGLNQVPIEGLSPDSEPDPARMAEVIAFAQEHQIKVIFFEELVNPKVAEVIAKAINAKTDVLNPVEGLTDEQIASGKDYISIMKQNLTAIKAALQ